MTDAIDPRFTKYVPCPSPYYVGCTRDQYPSGDVQGVWVQPEDEVVWTYHNNQIIGWTIKQKE